MRLKAATFLACGLLAFARPTEASVQAARSAPAAPVAVDEIRHGRADRFVVWLKAGAGLTVAQQGDSLLLTWPGATMLAAPRSAISDATAVGRFGQWIKGVMSEVGRARVQLAPGAHPRLRQWATRMWIDVDAGASSLAPGQFLPVIVETPAAAPTQAAAKPAAQVSVSPAPGTPGSATRTFAPRPALPVRQTAIQTAQSAPSVADSGLRAGSIAPAVSLVSAPAGLSGASISLPVSAASAGFTRSGQIHVVFDAPVALDLAALKDDPNFGSIVERLLPGGAVLQFRAPAGAWPQLTHNSDGWVLTLANRPAPPGPSDGGHAARGVLELPEACPGGVVTMDDEATGARLLIGTQRCARAGISANRQTSELSMLPSWQGLVIEPASDRVRLHAIQTGFSLDAADPPALNLVWRDVSAALGPDGREMTRRFDFPALSPAVLRRRLDEALRDAARTPRTDRLGPRLRVAQAMLAAGLDSEALAVLRVANTDDPTSSNNAGLQGLAAIASWLVCNAGGGQPPSPDLDASSLGDSDESMVWRALWLGNSDAPAAAAMLASRWRLLLDYPGALRRAMLPMVARVLQRGGQDAALTQLLGVFPDEIPALDLARAGELDRHGQSAQSLAILDRLGIGRDRWVRAQAKQVATEQRLAHHIITPATAAAQLDKQIYNWRGGERELRLRLRTAELSAQSGDWRTALSLLHDTDTLFPDLHARVRAAQLGVISGLLHGDGPTRMSALDVISLADAAANLLGPDDAEVSLAPILADRLLSLDLPDRAEPILRRLLDNAGDGVAASGLGLRLAGLIAERGDTKNALAALDSSGQAPTDAATRERRAVLKAGLLMKVGQPREALALLSDFGGKDAMLLQATILELAKDYSGAARALATLAKNHGFAATTSATQRDIILRAVRDDAEIGDLAALRVWRADYAKSFVGQPGQGLFNVLTAEPVSNVADLGRAGRELGEMRALPASLAIARVQR